jgi:two-component system chemotaxis response regulator CheB
MGARVINVLIVDDSEVARMMLRNILEADPELRVVGAVDNGEAAVGFVQRQLPDVILMDLQMPKMDGFEATRRIMETRPAPIVVCSAAVQADLVAEMFRVIEAGALTCVEKPVGHDHPEFSAMADKLRHTVKLMSEVKVVRRWPRSRTARVASLPARPPAAGRGIHVIGIGASTGGPQVLQQILATLPKDFAAPILVVQHIATGFLPGLAEWLNQTTAFRVQIGAYGMRALPGHVYLAPDDFHMGIGDRGHLRLTKEAPENGLRPAVSYLFRSLAEVFGSAAVGVLLTGMGTDGAAELKYMRAKGAVTIAQDRDTSIVYGMPGEAVRIGGVNYVLPCGKIADAIITIVNDRSARESKS